MKHLTLIRHAKSSWGDHNLRDHDRPLNERGERDAPRIGRALAERGYKPEAIVASTALRAQMTARAIAAELDFPDTALIAESRIYAAGVSSLLEVIAGIDDNIQSAYLIGHNPGFHDLANTFLPGDPIHHIPTCAVVHLELPVEHWALADSTPATLLDHLTPKTLP